jgi:regulator of replication initiation timing
MSDLPTSKTLSIPDGELWSLVRSLISQGTYIQMDATAGKYKHSEEFFARIDEAARERAEEILTKYSAPEPCTVYGGEVHICKNGKYQINRKESCHHCSEITTRAVEIDGDLFNVPEPVAKAIARLRATPPPCLSLQPHERHALFVGAQQATDPTAVKLLLDLLDRSAPTKSEGL